MAYVGGYGNDAAGPRQGQGCGALEIRYTTPRCCHRVAGRLKAQGDCATYPAAAAGHEGNFMIG